MPSRRRSRFILVGVCLILAEGDEVPMYSDHTFQGTQPYVFLLNNKLPVLGLRLRNVWRECSIHVSGSLRARFTRK